MTGYEILKEMEMRRAGTSERRFIKWWRKENDFVDYELIDTFLANLTPDDQFSGFELLTAEQIWDELQRRAQGRVTRGLHHGETVIRWQHMAEDGSMREELLPFEPQAIIKVFEEETHGDTMA